MSRGTRGVSSSNVYVKQAMLQTLGHLIAIAPEHFNVGLLGECHVDQR